MSHNTSEINEHFASPQENRPPVQLTMRARLTDRRKWPRKWWWPFPEQVDLPLSIDLRKKQHDDVSTSINTLLLSLLTYVFLFCATILSKSDAELLPNTARIKVPIADVEIPVISFLLIAPLVLIAFSFYLHIFVGYWLKLSPQQSSESDSTPPFQTMPFIFNLDSWLARFFSNFLFYWLVPVILAWFTWKALPLAKGFYVAFYTSSISIVLLFLQLRRRPSRTSTRHSLLLWTTFLISMYVEIGVVISLSSGVPIVSRPVYLDHATFSQSDLRGVQLSGAFLDGANLRSANLSGAYLRGAFLTGADLSGADLSGANLIYAYLGGANLTGAELTGVDLTSAYMNGANLSGAFLNGADLSGVYLIGADLNGAHLNGAHLRTVVAISQSQIDEALGDPTTELPAGITRPKSWFSPTKGP
jgi:hypothetical protein